MIKIFKKLSKNFLALRLRDKFMISYLFLLIIPLTVTGFFLYTFSAGIVEKQTRRVVSQTLKQTGIHLDFMLGEVENMGRHFFNNVEFQKILKRRSTTDYEDATDYWILMSEITQLKSYPQIYNVRLYVPDYKYYAQVGENVFPMKELQTNVNVAALIREKRAMGWTGSYTFENTDGSKENIISYIVILKDIWNSEQIIGYLFIDIREAYLFDILKNINIGENETALIFNDKREIVAGAKADSELVNIIANSAAMWEKKSGAFENVSFKGVKHTLIFENINRVSWDLVYAVPVTEISKEIGVISKYTTAIILCFGFLATAAAVLISNRITRKIRKLINEMREFYKIYSMNNQPADSDIFTSDEISQLQANFDTMLNRINQLIKENYEVQLEKREAELKALQAQINPHFLYNVLDSINWMAIRARAMVISDMATSLGRFYKIGLSGGKDIILMREELEHVRLYLDIQKMRCGDGLDVRFSIQEEVLDYPTVKFIIQPIVENAIFHGIMSKESQKGIIEIQASFEGDGILICVRDDAASIELEKVNGILNDTVCRSMSGYGLRNVNERIKLFFGEQFGLSFKKDSCWSVAEVWLPAVKYIKSNSL